jgi:TolA-binding protein
MRLFSTLVIAAAAPTIAATARAQVPAEDDGRSRAIRQAGAPSVPALPSANDSLFRRAEQLVREGRGEAGRALVDTLLSRTRPPSTAHAEALYWRGSLAAAAAEAERGYRRVIVEYPATRWAGDALLNLAQLELARGDQEQALLHLYRFEREYPSHESRARAAFWLARLHFDRRNEPRGCAALATARVAASPEDIELRNQIDYYGQRCIGIDTAGAAPARPVVAASSTAHTPASIPASAPRVPVAAAPASQPGASRASQGVAPPAVAPAPVMPAPAVQLSDSAAGQRVNRVGYTVQVAAFDNRAGAEALIERLKTRGYRARLASNTRPFRVRIGRYNTRSDAIVAQRQLRARGVEGFVTEVER